jgi:hypothetical protein
MQQTESKMGEMKKLRAFFYLREPLAATIRDLPTTTVNSGDNLKGRVPRHFLTNY